ncbi:hypothetical protein OIO90_003817 [Microbotryomycetes sp. JL221]|nr:hypothetical protein OIO90_003817 [Microbotryomycetes sp. JL221]
MGKRDKLERNSSSASGDRHVITSSSAIDSPAIIDYRKGSRPSSLASPPRSPELKANRQLESTSLRKQGTSKKNQQEASDDDDQDSEDDNDSDTVPASTRATESNQSDSTKRNGIIGAATGAVAATAAYMLPASYRLPSSSPSPDASVSSGGNKMNGSATQQSQPSTTSGPKKLRRKSLSQQNKPSSPSPPSSPVKERPAVLRRSSSRGSRLSRAPSRAGHDEEPPLRRTLSRSSSVRSREQRSASRGPATDDDRSTRDRSSSRPRERSQSRSRGNGTAAAVAGGAIAAGAASQYGRQDAPARPRSVRSTMTSQSRRGSIVAAPPLESKWDSDDDRKTLDRRDSRKKTATKKGGAVRKQDTDGEGQGLELTPHDRHYLNRIFVNLQMSHEGAALSKVGQLAAYGYPFLSHPNGPNSRLNFVQDKGGLLARFSGPKGPQAGYEDFEWSKDDLVSSPILRYLYWRFIYNLPPLNGAKQSYWTDYIQVFWDSFTEKDLSTTLERSEVTKRRLLAMGLTRIVGTYTSTCMPPLGRQTPARPTMAMMRRIDHLVPGSMDAMWYSWFPDYEPGYTAWTAIVSEENHKREPTYLVVSRVLVVDPNPTYLVSRKYSDFVKLGDTLDALDTKHELQLPLLPRVPRDLKAPPRARLQQYLRLLIISLSAPPEGIADDSNLLLDARNKLESFLLGNAEDVDAEELEDWVERGEREEDKAEELRQKWVKIGQRGKTLRTTWTLYRTALIEGSEMDKSIAVLRKTSTIKALPPQYRDAEEWARIWVAYALHYFFVGSSTGEELLGLLKSFHDLVPYGALKLGLSLVNPTLAIRAIVQIILGQPAGQPSLFQRIFQIICNSQIKTQKKLVAEARNRVRDEGMCNALERHVYASYMERQRVRQRADEQEEDIVVTIMQEYSGSQSAQSVSEWAKEFDKWERKGSIESKRSGNVSRFIDLKDCLAALCRKRDREQVVAVIMEPNTPRALHESIAVFYNTIYKVANASNLSARLGDLQAFLDDLIKTGYSEHNKPSDFIKLAARHDQSLYFLMYEIASNGGTLLDPLIEWSRSGLNFINEGIPPVEGGRPRTQRRASTSSRKSGKRESSSTKGGNTRQSAGTSTRAGVDFDDLLSRQPTDVQQNILNEARQLARWTKYRKAFFDICLRIDLGEVEGMFVGLEELDGGILFDRDELYEDLICQDWELKDVLQDKKLGDGGFSWAWFAEEQVEQVSSWEKRKLEQYKTDQAKKKADKASGGGGLFRTKSRATTTSDHGTHKKDDVVRKAVPDPVVHVSRELLNEYFDAVHASLDNAREREIK